MEIETIIWEQDQVKIIDQTKLPIKLEYCYYKDYKDVIEAIKQLKVRGAPAIGVAGAMAFVLAANTIESEDFEGFYSQMEVMGEEISSVRPTAVNLTWAIKRMKKICQDNNTKSIKSLLKKLKLESQKILEEDQEMSRQIGKNGAALLKNNITVLTHCNAGGLATGGGGTALAIIYTAVESGKDIKVYADETRPLLQGSRLTAWELMSKDVHVTVISDSMAGWLMKQEKINCVIVGADRIAKNGDIANKIGTYTLSVLAKNHNIPFYVAAPSSTLDLALKNGKQIPIEERDSNEITESYGVRIAPYNVNVYNPAFDITPAENISAIITEKKVFFYPFDNLE